ncbi:MAG TPA: DUF1800 domain-containing protein [Thermoanaerobaculia bacterium]|nr:DUF1800 domain-containing protein [Thermoanaerobaculia bacterium]
MPETSLSRRNLFTAGVGTALASALAGVADDPLFAQARPGQPLADWQATPSVPSLEPLQPLQPLQAAASGPPPTGSGLPAPDPVVFLVNRITFGLRADDLAHAQDIGFDAFVEEQLNPEQIDDSEVDGVLSADFPTLFMRPSRLLGLDRKQVTGELLGATVYRALASRRQLFELMVDFWSNHFNIFLYEKEDYWLKTPDDRGVVRRLAFGSFGDLLQASAMSPAMLSYLDNAANTKKGPNENYAREVMELHTLGVNGGYTQQDVGEVAHCFTGWTIQGTGPKRGTFYFNPSTHDDRAHTVLGQAIPAGIGIGQGMMVLQILANHPATATRITTKLCTRFVSDSPPQSLLNAAAQTFTATGGDIRQVMRTILTSGEFKASADLKLRRPFEVVAAAFRALGAELGQGGLASLLGALGLMGQVPFNWPAPNGYPDANPAWANTNGMISRWNLGLGLGANALKGVTVNFSVDPGLSAAQLTDRFTRQLVARRLLPPDRAKLIAYVAGTQSPHAPLNAAQIKAKLPGLVALVLDSPYFQWR